MGWIWPKKIHTDKHERWNLIERLHRPTLTIEHDWNMDEYDQIYINKKKLRRQTWIGEFAWNNTTLWPVCKAKKDKNKVSSKGSTPVP